MPHLNQLEAELDRDRFQLLVVSDEEPGLLKLFLDKREMPGWVVADTDRSVFESFGIERLPATVVVDGDGKVALRGDSRSLTTEVLGDIADGTFVSAQTVEENVSEEFVPTYPPAVAGFDPLATPFIDAGQVDMRKLPYQTILRRTMDPHAAEVLGTTDRGGGSGITAIAKSVQQLAGFIERIPVTRIVDESDLDDSTWDLIMARPEISSAQLKQEAGRVLDEVFNFQRRRINEDRSVLVAKLQNSRLKHASDIVPDDPTHVSFIPLIGVLRRFEVLKGVIVVEEIDDIGNLRIDTFGIDFFRADAPTLGTWLEDNGVTLEPGERTVELLRLVPTG